MSAVMLQRLCLDWPMQHCDDVLRRPIAYETFHIIVVCSIEYKPSALILGQPDAFSAHL